MKPSPFAYHRPEGLSEALDVLARVGADGKVLAGGQSLLPVLSMRLAAPAHVVDINRLHELAYVRSDPTGVRVGALARHAALERDVAAAACQPLLAEALRLVAHPVIRNRGTTVGSLAHADPAGEMTAVLRLLDGTVDLASASGRRTVAAADFFRGPLESAVGPGELAVEAFFPALPPGAGVCFLEVARRHGDYAVCGVGALVDLGNADGAASGSDGSGASETSVVRARVAYISMGPVPQLVDVTDIAATDIAAAAGADWDAIAGAAVEDLDPEPDIHATADYRLHLARVLTARALRTAGDRALHSASGAAAA